MTDSTEGGGIDTPAEVLIDRAVQLEVRAERLKQVASDERREAETHERMAKECRGSASESDIHSTKLMAQAKTMRDAAAKL